MLEVKLRKCAFQINCRLPAERGKMEKPVVNIPTKDSKEEREKIEEKNKKKLDPNLLGLDFYMFPTNE